MDHDILTVDHSQCFLCLQLSSLFLNLTRMPLWDTQEHDIGYIPESKVEVSTSSALDAIIRATFPISTFQNRLL
jgi:hypothetical protein